MPSLLQALLETTLLEQAPRRDQSARTRRVMAAVILECAAHGYKEARIVDIATRAKVSTATLYREYGDRDDLFIAALEMVIGLLERVWRPPTLPEAPLERLEALLLAHGRAWADPSFGWIIRMYIFYGNTKAPHLLVLGQAAFKADMAFWQGHVDGLEEAGLISGDDRTARLALILGAIERRTIFARLGFGENDDHPPALAAVARHSAHAFFRVYGTPLFWDRYGTTAQLPAAKGRVGKIDLPVAKMDPPSQRLLAYANKVLSSDVDRLDQEGRRARIQLAAMLTCMQHGYENATMANVAEAAKVSTATLYLDYDDKQKLFLDAMMMQARFRVDYNKLLDPASTPENNICTLVFSIASVLADPDFLWFHYVSMASELSMSPALIASSRKTRAHTEGFWLAYLDRLVDEKVLEPHDTIISMNLLLGATQRRSVQSLVLYGRNQATPDELAELSVASTAFLMRLYGKSVS
jgi:AcrR family transcriptional regulator